MNTRTYSFDAKARVWRTPAHDSIAYSDGAETESRLLDALRECHDVSLASEELRRQIVDWPSEYHFSAIRANLLRPFPIGNGVRVLELGCGCGALTRYFGESEASVTAVEGSLARARIAAERCRDLPNVRIVVDGIDSFQPDGKFDVVTLIGVLEYSPLFIGGDDPVTQCLTIARRLLAPGGTLLLAIENQLGLKYFNGCTEDHVGKHFFGLQDRYCASTPVTFGRDELQRRLKSAGFSDARFYFPFPDYKLPNILISEEALDVPELALHNLIACCDDRDYSGRRVQLFDEHLVWRVLARNGLFGDLANSFLVIGGVGDTSMPVLPHESWLAKMYAAARTVGWATETTISQDPSGLRVGKVALGSENNGEVRVGPYALLHHLSPDEPYIAGDLLLHRFQQLALEGSLAEMATLVRQWVDLLVQGHAPASGAMEDHVVPGDLVDCIPANLIISETGKLLMIDREWRIREPIPLAWVVLRGLVGTLFRCRFPHGFELRNCETVITELIALSGLTATPTTHGEVAALEDAFQAACSRGQSNRDSFQLALTSLLPHLQTFDTPSNELLARLEAQEHETRRLLESMSWRITKPLRLLAQVLLGYSGKK